MVQILLKILSGLPELPALHHDVCVRLLTEGEGHTGCLQRWAVDVACRVVPCAGHLSATHSIVRVAN